MAFSSDKKPEPIILHYYNGRFGFRAFGHTALQIGDYYFSFGYSKKEDLCSMRLDYKAEIESEFKIYGYHSQLEIPQKYYSKVPNMQAAREQFQKKWKPKEYKVLTHNCAHCATDGILTFLDHKALPDEVLKKLQALSTNALTRPAEANRAIGEMFQLVTEEKLEDMKRLAEDKKIPAKIIIEKFLDNLIEKLMGEIFILQSKSEKDKIKQIQIFIEKLIEVQNKLPRIGSKGLASELASLEQELMQLKKELKDQISDNVLAILKFCQSDLLQKRDIDKEIDLYEAEREKKNAINQRLFDYYCVQQDLLKLLPAKNDPYVIKPKIEKILEYLLQIQLDNIREGRELNLGIENALRELILICFQKEGNLEILQKNRRDRGKSAAATSAQEPDEFQKALHVFGAIPLDKLDEKDQAILALKAITDLVAQVKGEVENKEKKKAEEVSEGPNNATVVKLKPEDTADAKKVVHTSEPSGYAPKLFQPAEHKDEKAIQRKFITAHHFEWLVMQLDKINFWYKLNAKKKENDFRARSLIIAAYLVKRNPDNNLPVELFQELLEKIRIEWNRSIEKYGFKGKHGEIEDQAVKKLNKAKFGKLRRNKMQHTFTRDIGQVILCADAFVQPNAVNPRLAALDNLYHAEQELLNLGQNDAQCQDLFIAMKQNINAKFAEHFENNIFIHLKNMIPKLEYCAANNVLTYREALKEMIEEVNHAILFAKQEGMKELIPDLLFIKKIALPSVDNKDQVTVVDKSASTVTPQNGS